MKPWKIIPLSRAFSARASSVLGLILFAVSASATDLTIHLSHGASVSRQTVTYQCDASGTRIGVPQGAFPVEYINGGGNSLVVVPVSGNELVFSNVSSGSGARYTTQQYTWWDAHGSVNLSSNSLTGKLQSTCRRVASAAKQ
jgi:membrane-bound inhibitor of C-type lysozyme